MGIIIVYKMNNENKKYTNFITNQSKKNTTNFTKTEIINNTSCICLHKSHLTQTSKILKCTKCNT